MSVCLSNWNNWCVLYFIEEKDKKCCYSLYIKKKMFDNFVTAFQLEQWDFIILRLSLVCKTKIIESKSLLLQILDLLQSHSARVGDLDKLKWAIMFFLLDPMLGNDQKLFLI